VPKTAVIVFVAMIKVIAMKLVKFLIAKSLKLEVELSQIVNKAILIVRYPV